MNIALFIGIESYTWQLADFQPVVALAKAAGITTLLVKVFDGMQGEWYNGQFPQIYQLITGAGLHCVPYGFHYGNNKGSSLTGEATLAVKYGQTYGTYCADMESSWDGQGDWAAQLAGLIKTAQAQKPFNFWVSTWANVGDEAGGHSWLTNISHLAPVTQYFLPQAYNDSLYATMKQDWAQSAVSSAQIQPTFEISLTEFGQNNIIASIVNFVQNYSPQVISLWEWQWAEQNSAIVTQAIAALTGGSTTGGNVPLQLSPTGCVLDLAKSFQLDGGSQDKCGPWSVSELKYAGLPGHGPGGSASQVQAWASAEYTKYIGPDVVSNQNGSSIDNMHQFLKDAGLHWFDIIAISPGSTQSSDLANIHKALDAGYPVLVTVNELSVKRRDGPNPYPWQPRLGPVNHIFTIVGYTKDGYLLVDDELNQGDAWPDQYSAASIECHWASIVQVVGPNAAKPWLKPIPDPATTWPTGYNAQNFGVAVPPPPVVIPPPPVVAPPPVPLDDTQVWNVLGKAISFDLTHAIPKSWMAGRHSKGFEFGTPLEIERDVTRNGVLCKEQLYTNALASWNSATGVTTWRDARGVCFQS